MSPFEMQKFINEVCNEIGPRLGTSEQERQAGIKIKHIFETVADEAMQEEFSCHPAAYLDFVKVAFVVGIAACVFFFWLPLATFLLLVYAISMFIFETKYMKQYVDLFFAKRKTANVVGKLRARKVPKQIVLCSAHHDSANEFPLFAKFKANFHKLSGSTLLLLMGGALGSLVKYLLDSAGITLLGIDIVLFCLLASGIAVGTYVTLNLHSDKVILGANDNLSGVAVVLGVLHHFAIQRLQNVELWCVSFACEEAGLRGSKHFVAQHARELQNASIINYDMVGRGAISILSAEPGHAAVHSLKLAHELQQASKAAGVVLPIKQLRYGGTDAVSFSRRHIRAISVMGLTPQNYPDTWHELTDTPENLQAGRMEQTLQATIRYVSVLDAELEKGGKELVA